MLLLCSYVIISILGIMNLLFRNSNLFLFVSLIYLSILVGFRNMGGNDFILYENQYIHQLDSTWEQGYMWVSELFSSLGFSFQGFVFFISAFCLGVVHYSVRKYSPWTIFSIVLYMALYLFYYNIIALRQMFALTFVVFSFQFIEKRQLIPFAIMIFLSFLFHKSSIIFAIAYPFCVYYRFNIVSLILILSFSVILSFFDFPFFLSLLSGGVAYDLLQERFSDYATVEQNFSFSSFLKMGIVLFFVLIRYKEMKDKPYFDIFTKLYFIYMCLFLAFNKWSIMMRLYSYFEISFIFIIPMVLYYMNFNDVVKKILIYLFVIALFGVAYFITILNFDDGDMLLYSLEFEGFTEY